MKTVNVSNELLGYERAAGRRYALHTPYIVRDDPTQWPVYIVTCHCPYIPCRLARTPMCELSDMVTCLYGP